MPAKKNHAPPEETGNHGKEVPSPRPFLHPCVSSWREAAQWLRARGIEDIECITPDLAGVPRAR